MDRQRRKYSVMDDLNENFDEWDWYTNKLVYCSGRELKKNTHLFYKNRKDSALNAIYVTKNSGASESTVETTDGTKRKSEWKMFPYRDSAYGIRKSRSKHTTAKKSGGKRKSRKRT